LTDTSSLDGALVRQSDPSPGVLMSPLNRYPV